MKHQIIIIIFIFFTLYQVDFSLKVSCYYETLCPDSKKFIVQQLHKAYETFGDQISIELVPFGNVDEYRDEKGVLKYHCQHGIEECRGNKIQACVINDNWLSAKGRKAAMNLFKCMFLNRVMDRSVEKAGKECANKHFPGQWSQIWECATSDRGRDIYRIMARKTRELYPSPNYMPWITIDDQYDKTIQTSAENNLIQVICSMANPRPAQCGPELIEEQLEAEVY